MIITAQARQNSAYDAEKMKSPALRRGFSSTRILLTNGTIKVLFLWELFNLSDSTLIADVLNMGFPAPHAPTRGSLVDSLAAEDDLPCCLDSYSYQGPLRSGEGGLHFYLGKGIYLKCSWFYK